MMSTDLSRPPFVCFLAAHDAGSNVFMSMKRRISLFTRHKTYPRATSLSERGRKVSFSSFFGHSSPYPWPREAILILIAGRQEVQKPDLTGQPHWAITLGV